MNIVEVICSLICKSLWHHDIFRAKGTPYDKERLIKELSGIYNRMDESDLVKSKQ
jgi:hypothetical protein